MSNTTICTMKKVTTLFLLFSLATTLAFAGDIDVVDDITTDVTWTSDNVYYLDGFIFVEDGATLTIEPGTVVKGYLGTGENASALIVKRGGKIMAEGTAEAPIIFTAEDDDNLDQGTDIKGSWGGLILLGKGTHNNLTNDNGIEGVPAEAEAYYGGDIEDDNSGVLKFVSIRHGGSELAPDEEINGLTLGAVGSGTAIDYIEIMGNDDDGIEWFGGSVSSKYLIVNDVADDSYDIDEGFHGKIQFAYAAQADDGTGDNFGEHDGGPSSNRWGMPYSAPVFSNVTYIGAGPSGGNRSLTLREFFAGQYHNSVFAEQEKTIRVEYVEDFSAGANGGAFTQWQRGNLKIENNIFQNVGDGTPAGIFTVYSPVDDMDVPIYDVPTDSSAAFAAYFTTAGNTVNNSLGVSKSDPVPDSIPVKGAVFEGLGSWFAPVLYKGAFNPCVMDGNWGGGWSFTFASEAFDNDLTQECYDAIIDGIDEIETVKTALYPNPAVNYATLSFENNGGELFYLNVYRTNGQVVLTGTTEESSMQMDVTSLPAGVYVYTLINQQASKTAKGQLVVR